MSKPYGRLGQLFVAFLEYLNFKCLKEKYSSNLFLYSIKLPFDAEVAEKILNGI
jgi:hypothetical protein